MTHTPTPTRAPFVVQVHVYTPDAIEAWIASPQAGEAFQAWLASDDPDALRIWPAVRGALIGYAPTGTDSECRDYVRRTTVAFVVTVLWCAFHRDWIGTDHEHEAFHAWADPQGHPAVCSGCWL